MLKYGISIDNGASYSADLPERFDTLQDASVAGEEWLIQFYYDNGFSTPEQQEECGAGFEIFTEGEE